MRHVTISFLDSFKSSIIRQGSETPISPMTQRALRGCLKETGSSSDAAPQTAAAATFPVTLSACTLCHIRFLVVWRVRLGDRFDDSIQESRSASNLTSDGQLTPLAGWTLPE